jgi:septal ring factor EnvC (AmiA/AmiB activator)
MGGKLPRGKSSPFPKGGSRSFLAQGKALCLALAFGLMGGAAALGWAQDSPEVEELRRKAQGLAQRLAELSAQAARLEDRRGQLEAELALASLRLQEGETQVQLAQAEVAKARQALAELAEQASTRRTQLYAQLGALWSLRAALPAMVFSGPWGEPEEFVRRVTLLLAVVSYSRNQLTHLEELARQQAQAVAVLSQKEESLRQALQALGQRKAALAATRQRVLAELERLERERRQEATAFTQLQEAMSRLEGLWTRLEPGREPISAGVKLLRGGLPWPVEEGHLVRGFGRFRDPRYATVVLHPGWDLQVPPLAEVKAVAAGKVVYAQFFKDWGNVVILAHGEEVYTLYGRLATMFVSSGQRVSLGQALGLAGPAGSESNLYFEVRNGSKAHDPASWLRPRGSR